MSQTPADPLGPSCNQLHFASEIEESQSLAPDRVSPRAPARARDQRGRFAKGSSGNPRGRPPGIPNPKRRVVGIAAFRRNPDAAMALFKRKPHLLRQLTQQFMPPARTVDPAERIGIDLAAVRTHADAAQALRA